MDKRRSLIVLAPAGLLAIIAICQSLNLAECRRHHEIRWTTNDGYSRPRTAQRLAPKARALTVDHSQSLQPFVYDQLRCPHGWAYAGINALEFHLATRTRYRKPLSAMSITNCYRPPPNGAYPLNGAFILAELGGVPTNESYFVSGGYNNNGQQCKEKCYEDEEQLDWKLENCVVSGEIKSIYNNEISIEELKKKLDSGPLVVGVQDDLIAKTKGGDILPFDCEGYKRSGGQINHAVLLTGHGELNGKQFFYYKNSRGLRWGSYGYGHIEIDPSGVCNTFSNVALPSFKC